MAKTDHIIATLIEEDYRVNGVSVLGRGDADEYLECAHGVLSFVTGAMSEAGCMSKLSINPEVTFAALRGAEALLQLGMWQKDHERQAAHLSRRAA